jgi:hypothetical protein
MSSIQGFSAVMRYIAVKRIAEIHSGFENQGLAEGRGGAILMS